MNYITKEILRAIKSRWFIVSLLVSLGLLFVGLVAFYSLDPTPPPGWHFAHRNAYDAWKSAVSDSVFVLFAPLAATLAYADSYAQERSQRFSRYVLLRLPHSRYLAIKFVVNGLVGGLAVALPMALCFGFTWLHYPRVLPPLSGTVYPEEWMRCVGFLGELYVPAPQLYVGLRLGLGFLFGSVYATHGMALSAFTANRYVILSFPLLSHLIIGFVVNALGIPAFWSAYALVPDGIRSSTAVTIFVPLAVLFLLSLGCAAVRIQKYRPPFY